MNSLILLLVMIVLQPTASFSINTNQRMKSKHPIITNGCLLHLLPPDVSHGEELFRQFCTSCHVGGTNAISRERNLQKEALEKFVGLTEEEDSIVKFVKNSNIHRGALAFTGRLSDQDFKDVARYVYIQAMESKW